MRLSSRQRRHWRKIGRRMRHIEPAIVAVAGAMPDIITWKSGEREVRWELWGANVDAETPEFEGVFLADRPMP